MKTKKDKSTEDLENLIDPEIKAAREKIDFICRSVEKEVYESISFMEDISRNSKYSPESRKIAQKASLQLKGIASYMAENGFDHNTPKDQRDTIKMNLDEIRVCLRQMKYQELVYGFREMGKILEEK